MAIYCATCGAKVGVTGPCSTCKKRDVLLAAAAAAMGRKGGKARSERKTRAVRANAADSWIAARLTVAERDAIRWALGVYLAAGDGDHEVAPFETQRRADAETALAKLQVTRKEPPHDD